MPRRYSETFSSAAIADLTRQLLFSPAERRRDQVVRAEALHDQLDPDANYPLDFVQYRITGYHSETPEPVLLVGASLQADLRLMIHQLSRSTAIEITQADAVVGPAELAAELAVSTKTINRWRREGLRWRWMTVAGERVQRLVFPRPGVELFLQRHQARVTRAARFSHVDPRTRRRVVARARRLLAADPRLTMNHVAAQLAPRFGRSAQTVRRLLEQYDRENPVQPLFGVHNAPLNEWEKRLLQRAHQRGVSMAELVRRLRRSRSTLYRALREQQAERWLTLPIHYVALPVFDRDDAQEVLLRPLAAEENANDSPTEQQFSTVPVSDLPPALQTLFVAPIVTRQDQQSLSVRMNYLRYRAARVRQQINAHDPRVVDLEQVGQLLARADGIRARLVRANLPVVLSVARRHEMGHDDLHLLRLLDLLELGVDVLIRAIDDYDPSQHSSIERYVVWRLMQQFVREQLKAETTLAEPKGQPLTRAHRREDPRDVLDRILQRARQLGVRLDSAPPAQPRPEAPSPGDQAPPSPQTQ